jgi:lycopene cyclase domain-containing protein
MLRAKKKCMSYADFLAIFLLAPLLALALVLQRRLLNRRYLASAGALMLVALIFMAPWDHTAAVWGLWTWSAGQTWGIRWWGVPPEEYLFCLLEALLAVTLLYALLLRLRRDMGAGTSARDTHSEERS